MLCTINDYSLADGTISGGWSLSGLRLGMQRIFDKVIVLGAVSPAMLDRNKRRCDISFTVQRVHATIKDAEIFIYEHEETVPRTGDIKLIADVTGPTTNVVALIVNGELLSQELVRQIGKFTEHSYQITGSPIFAPTPGTDKLLLETGDFILLETGDKILLE